MTQTAQEILDNAKANAAAKPPKTSTPRNPRKPKNPVTASAVHDEVITGKLADYQDQLADDDQAIVERAIADEIARKKALYFSTRAQASKHCLEQIVQISSETITDRAVRKSANLLAPQPTAQLQLTGSADAVSALPTCEDWCAWESEDEA